MKGYPVDTWEATRNKAINKIKKAAEDSDSELLEEVAEESDPKKRKERESNCMALRMVFDKCLEDYQEGEYSFKQTIDMLCEAFEELK